MNISGPLSTFEVNVEDLPVLTNCALINAACTTGSDSRITSIMPTTFYIGSSVMLLVTQVRVVSLPEDSHKGPCNVVHDPVQNEIVLQGSCSSVQDFLVNVLRVVGSAAPVDLDDTSCDLVAPLVNASCDPVDLGILIAMGYNAAALDEAARAVDKAEALRAQCDAIQDPLVTETPEHGDYRRALKYLCAACSNQYNACTACVTAVAAGKNVEEAVVQAFQSVQTAKHGSVLAFHETSKHLQNEREQYYPEQINDKCVFRATKCGSVEPSKLRECLSIFGTHVSIDCGGPEEFYLQVKLNEGVDTLDLFKAFVELAPRALPFFHGM